MWSRAALFQLTAYYINIESITSELLGCNQFRTLIISKTGSYNTSLLDFISEGRLSSMYFDYNAVMVGASGAIYGVVVAFAFLFPNSRLMLLFLNTDQTQVSSTLLILGDLFFGFTSASIGPIAHFAHIGGAVTGFLIMWY